MAKKVKVELDFDFGDTVYLNTDPDGIPRLVIEIRLLPGGVAVYMLACGEENTEHYALEITDQKPIN